MPGLTEVIEIACRAAGVGASVRLHEPLAGGCMHDVRKVDLDDDTSLVAKIGPRDCLGIFEEQEHGLRAIAAADAVRVSAVLQVSVSATHAVLLLEWIEPGQPDKVTWEQFGEHLAALHGSGSWMSYGFHHDNHLGSTPQPNAWQDDWVLFNQEQRLGHQLRLACAQQRLKKNEVVRVEKLIENLAQHIPQQPPAALLHGDLWSGNALVASDRRVVVIDPACSVGDGWADIAMMQLFGGFPEACFTAYRANVDDHDEIDERIAVYQLYHVLNHVNLFGNSYVASAIRLLERLGY